MTTPAPGFALWLTGLPSSGKSILARALGGRLEEAGVVVEVLDSDDLRGVLTPEPTYSADERDWFYATLLFIASLLVRNGVNVIIAATASRRAYREAARAHLPRFGEVFVDCPPRVCRERDPKGLWEKADRGEITSLPGAGAPYEPPLEPEVVANTAELTVDQAVGVIWRWLQSQDHLAS
jgi:adenylylsulfate kinase